MAFNKLLIFLAKKKHILIQKKSISKEELNSLPIKSFEGKIVVIDNIKDVDKYSQYLNNQTVLGFDTETRPTFKKGKRNKVALLQLSTNDVAFIFRLNSIGLPLALVDILKNNEIIKSGVAIRDDILALRNIVNFKPAGFVELQKKAKELGIENFGLKKLAGLVLGFRISKAQQTSNWEAEKLTNAQIKYAATDAWVSLNIYLRLEIDK